MINFKIIKHKIHYKSKIIFNILNYLKHVIELKLIFNFYYKNSYLNYFNINLSNVDIYFYNTKNDYDLI